MTSPLKWHGGKHFLASKIVDLTPPHIHYVEPYFGSGAVMFAKDPEGVSEVANDVNAQLMNFFTVIVDADLFPQFQREAELTPFSELLWRAALKHLEHPCVARENGPCPNCAHAFFIACRQSLAGRMKSFAPLSKRRTRRGMNEQVSAWLASVEGLADVHTRLKRVAILSRPALDVIVSEDTPGTLFYLDPPYLSETRESPSVYYHEMSKSQHFDLLAVALECQGKVMISGYRSKMYDGALKEWNRHDFQLPNNAAGGDEKRLMTECLWCNF